MILFEIVRDLDSLKGEASKFLHNLAELPDVHYPSAIKMEARSLKEFNEYKIAMARKAKTHMAKDFKFVAIEKVDVEDVAEKSESQGRPKKQSKKSAQSSSAKKIIEDNYKKKWTDIRDHLRKLTDKELSVEFRKVQETILDKLRERESEKEVALKSCIAVLAQPLQDAEKRLRNYVLGTCANPELFETLGITLTEIDQNQETPQKIIARLRHTNMVDKKLNQRLDKRCVNFRPTALQRLILDGIDNGDSILVKSPTSSGKTMLSLYLINRMVKMKKKTVYLAPNKAVSNEFALFVHNHNFRFTVGTEDFFNYDEIRIMDVIICTPPILQLLFLFGRLKDTIGAIIFDETPHLLEASGMFIFLLTTATLKWQSLALSATFGQHTIQLLTSIIPFKIVEIPGATRPTDLKLMCYNASANPSLKPLCTWATYSQQFFEYFENTGNYPDDSLRVPVSLQEVQEIVAEGKISEYIIKKTLSLGTNSLKNENLTQLALQYSIQQSQFRHVHFNGSKGAPSGKQLFQLLNDMRNGGMLPTLVYCSDRDTLDLYHKELTEFMLEILKKEEDSAVKTSKKAPKMPERKRPDKEDFLEDTEKYEYSSAFRFGKLEEEELAEIFKHKRNDKGFKFGKRGTRVLKSHLYPGVRLGIGIDHHGIDSAMRDAVESGIRLGYLKVVLCDKSLAFGVNLPVKSVVFIHNPNQPLEPEDFVQISGRAGRWGRDAVGTVVFAGFDEEEIRSAIWGPFKNYQPQFPIDLPLLFQLCAASKDIREFLPNWANMELPEWNWNSDTTSIFFAQNLKILQQLGLIQENLSLTLAGKVALSLSQHHYVSLLAGFAIAKYLPQLKSAIQSVEDYIVMFSHFLDKDKCLIRGIPTLGSLDYPGTLPTLMHRIQQEFLSVSKLDPQKFVQSSEITAFYLLCEKETVFEILSSGDWYSYVTHFLDKMKQFHSVCPLLYGYDTIKFLEKVRIQNM